MLTIYTLHAGDCDHRDDMNWETLPLSQDSQCVAERPKPAYRGEDFAVGNKLKSTHVSWKRKMIRCNPKKTVACAINDSRCGAAVSRRSSCAWA
jgi:hypothetical protein